LTERLDRHRTAASLPSISNIKDAPVPMSDCAITSGG
jgi:hypothetical protein